MPPFSWNPGIWLGQNWMYIVGWAAALTLLYRGYLLVSRFASYGQAITDLQTDMVSIKENHLPHIQEELTRVNENITGLRGDLKDGLARMSDDLRLVLTRMP